MAKLKAQYEQSKGLAGTFFFDVRGPLTLFAAHDV